MSAPRIAVAAPGDGARRLLRRIIREHRAALAGAAGSSVLITAAELAAPWPLKWVLDTLLADRTAPFTLGPADVRLLVLAALATVGIAAVNALGSYTGDLWLRRAGERIAHDLRVRTYAHLQRLSLAFHDKRKKGDLVTRVTDDANRVGEGFAESLGAVSQAALTIVGMLTVGLLLDPVLGVALGAVVPVLVLVTTHYRRRVRLAARRQRSRDGEIASLAAESLSAIRLVQAHGSEAFEEGKVAAQSEERRVSGVEVAVLEARFAGLVDVLGAVATALVLALGVVRVSTGAITVGAIVVFVQYARRLYRPLKDIAKHSTKISKAMARADRIADVLGADEILPEPVGAAVPGRAAGGVTLRDVHFSYAPDRPVLGGVDLVVPPGARVAFVGDSGAGKSTLAALVARFYDPTSGQVLLDGHDLRDRPLRWVRAQVGVLLQDTVLLTGTVAENIAYGTTAGPDAVREAATAADAHEFISRLPGGYDHVLGPQGVGLSGGQRQRLGIARVLLRDPSVLVLDEPTTGLDPASEAAVIDRLEALMAGRTTLVVTHSMALAQRSDRVVVMRDGRVVQDGSPVELLASPGPYRRMSREQGVAGAVRLAATAATGSATAKGTVTAAGTASATGTATGTATTAAARPPRAAGLQ